MASLTLAQAQAHLNAWLAADLACATGQSYTIGSRTLTRADAATIATTVDRWRREVDQLTAGSSGVRVVRAIPRDL